LNPEYLRITSVFQDVALTLSTCQSHYQTKLEI